MTEDTKTATQEPKARTISDILKESETDIVDSPDISPEALDKADLSLPDEFQLDSMAAELVEHLANYHKANAGRKAARAQGDGQKAEQMFKLMSYSRLAAAYIEQSFPGVKAVADVIARTRAIQVKRARQQLLSAESED